MKISKINAEPTETANQQTFKGLKLRTSTLSQAKRAMKRDSFELRKNLPDNQNSKVNKYFGQPAGDGPHEASTADVAVAIGAIAVGLGLAFL